MRKYDATSLLFCFVIFMIIFKAPALGYSDTGLYFETDNTPWYGPKQTDDPTDEFSWANNNSPGKYEFVIKKQDYQISPAQIRLRFFPTDYMTRVSIKINGAPIGTALKEVKTESVRFDVPEGLLVRGKNTLEIDQFIITRSDGHKTSIGSDAFDSFDIEFNLIETAGTSTTNNTLVGNPRGRITNTRGPNTTPLMKPQPGTDTDGILENEGDYLILTHPDFTAALQPLANLRTSEGFTVRVVTLTQIYSVFPEYPGNECASVKSFLQYAWDNWGMKPKYILLVGGWSPAYPEWQMFPVYSYMYSCEADDYFGDFEYEGADEMYPEVPVGRIAAVTAQQVTDYVTKVLYYEGHLNEYWNTSALVLLNDYEAWNGCAENEDPPDGFEEYQQLIRDFADELGGILEPYYTTDQIRSADYSTSLQRWQALTTSLNNGKAVVFFTGRADFREIGTFLNDFSRGSGRTEDLTNVGKYPIFIGSGCNINNFSRIRSGEFYLGTDLILAPNKATVAAIANTSKSQPQDYFDLFHYMALHFGRGQTNRIGDVYLEAKSDVYHQIYPRRCPDLEQNYCMTLSGDPGLHIMGTRDNCPALLPGWPQYTDEPASPVAAGDITPNLGQQQPACVGIQSRIENSALPALASSHPDVIARGDRDLYAWGGGGQGYFNIRIPPIKTPPLLADINADGVIDIITPNAGYSKICVLDKNGTELEGFPVGIPSIGVYPPAIGDVNGDGYLEIICVGGSGYTYLYAIDHNGQILPGWPKHVGSTDYLWQTPSVGDVDADGDLEVVITTGNKLYVFSDDATGAEDTLTFGSSINAGRAVLADLDSDPDLEIVVGCEKIAADGGTDYEIPNLFILNRVNGVYTVQSQYSTVGDKGILFPPCVGDFRPQHEGKEIITLVTGWSQQDGYLDCWTTTGGTLTCISHRSLGVNITPTSAPTVADVIKDPPPNNGYEVLFGTPGKLSCYRAFYDMSEAPNWDGGLTGDVTTPLVTDLNADGKTDIVCSDYEAVYAFTTGNPYDGLENFDWVRDGHDNLNMGLWDIAAPTGLAAIDNPDDQGGKITLTWAPSVDDGMRSTRVTSYEIWGTSGEILPDAGTGNGGNINPALDRKIAEGKRAAFIRGEAFAAPISLTGSPGETNTDLAAAAPTGGKDSGIFGLIGTVPAGTYTYEVSGLDNGLAYEYFIVATDGTRDAQKSVTVQVIPHDNIAPAPPTTFAGVYNEMDINVHLTWDLSADDPYHEEGQPGDAIAGSPAGPGALSPFPNRAGAPYGGNRGGAAASSGLDTAAYAGLPTDLAPSALGTVAGFGDEAAGMSDRQKEFLKKKIASALPGAPKGYYAPPPQGFPNYGRDGGANDVVQYRITKSVNGGGSVVSFFVTCGTTEFYDYDVSLGNLYGYTICAMDAENYSSEAGPVEIDLRSGGEGDAGGPLAAAPAGPLGEALPDDPRRASDPGSIAAGGFLEGGAHPASVITCRPNPIKGTATFQINVRKATRATLSVFDVSGRKVATVYDGPLPAGGMSATWAADVPNGIYLYTLETEEKRYSGKTAVLR